MFFRQFEAVLADHPDQAARESPAASGASLLRARGFSQVADVSGGFGARAAAALATTRPGG